MGGCRVIRAITRQGSVTANYVCPHRLGGDRRGGDPDLPASTDYCVTIHTVCVCVCTCTIFICAVRGSLDSLSHHTLSHYMLFPRQTEQNIKTGISVAGIGERRAELVVVAGDDVLLV